MAAGPIVLACGSDDLYALPLAVTLHSALSRLAGPARVFVIDGGIGPANRRKLAEVVRRARADAHLEFARPDLGRLAGVKTEGYYRVANYFRLLIPEVVPAEFDRAIYLDSDLLVRADPAGLWEADLGGKAILAAVDCGAPTLGSPRGLANWSELGLDPGLPYVNSGVLVMDLRRWRAEGIAAQVMRHLIDHREHVRFADQDGINAVLCRDCRPLDPRWNVPAFLASESVFEGLEEGPYKDQLRAVRWRLIREARIYHFVGSRKPWQFGAGLPGQWQWLRALERSGWYGPRELAPRLRAWALRADWLARKALRAVRRRASPPRAGPGAS